MDAQTKRASIAKLNFLSMLNNEIMLWSDARLETARQDIFIQWCFDTGDQEDLLRFKELDAETETRKTWRLIQVTDPE